jgi:hypothetical protein
VSEGPILEITVDGQTADEAFDALCALPQARLKTDHRARTLVEAARRRVEPAELRLTDDASIALLLDWIATNLESEEGLLDEDTPPHLARTVKAAVALLNDPLQPMPCIRKSASSFVFFDRRVD